MCKKDYNGEKDEERTKLKERSVRMYRQHIRQPQYQQLKVKGHLRLSGNGELPIFLFFRMRPQNTDLR